MREKYQFEKPLGLMKVCLLLSGVKIYHKQWHPIIEKLVNPFLFYFNLVILYTVIFAEIYWMVEGIQIGRDFVEMSLTAPCITITILSTLKITPLYFKRDIVCQIIDKLKEIHPKITNETDIKTDKDTGRKIIKTEKIKINTEDRNYIEEKHMTVEEVASESIKRLQIVAFLISSIMIAVLITFLLAPLVSLYLRYYLRYATGEMKIKYPFSVKYWFDVYQVTLWPLVYFHQVWATVIVTFNVFGTEILFYSICTYIEMHFRILCYRFESIQSGSSRRIQRELMAGVKVHQLLIHLVEQTESLFSQPALVHIVSSSLLICLSAFNITVAKEIGSVVAFVTFLSLSLSQVFLLCFFGDKLMRSSTEVSGAVYKCPWYNFDVTAKKVVLIIIIRAQKPCKLTASNFADLNLRAFTTILSRSWSYFALLKTVYN